MALREKFTLGQSRPAGVGSVSKGKDKSSSIGVTAILSVPARGWEKCHIPSRTVRETKRWCGAICVYV
ncbi:Protein TIFY 3B [Anopheles sinensis]|uniref:Protein TIFY 3B n=1 Tax=Anopheles sinensis TaxID=74873 RepID=A0A084WNL6_ANOSI|nr:Protein TIFY 3B [Anopheles sinensis]